MRWKLITSRSSRFSGVLSSKALRVTARPPAAELISQRSRLRRKAKISVR